MRRLLYGVPFILWAGMAFAQSTTGQVAAILNRQVNQPDIVSSQLKQFLVAHAPHLPMPSSAAAWTAESARLRKHLLDDVYFHGWPKEWIESPPRFEDMGPVPSGNGYRMRKLRYEVVPGFWSTAILYEPEKLKGKVPAILNVNGHVGPEGKSVEYKQKRCINFALRGMIALNLEWIGQGELSQEQNQHYFAGHLDLVGANGEGLFYLEMRRGLDYLYDLPNVDRARIGMTGLSGGGWQTLVLGSLDPRVKVAVPVAGYEALASWIPRMPTAAGDNEQAGTDTFVGLDYATMTAMRAPRPTLLIYNAEDNCCFRSALVKPFVYNAIKPFFALYDRANALQYHENTDPSTHNYEIDNRVHAYRFFARYLNVPDATTEIPVDEQVKSYKDLEVGLPKDNLTILTLAKKFASEFRRTPIPPPGPERHEWAHVQKNLLRRIMRFKPVSVTYAPAVATTKDKGVESLTFRFEFSNNLPATGIWVKAIRIPDNAPISIILNDRGKKLAADDVSNRVNHGDQVLAVDLLFTGDASTEGIPRTWAFPEMIAAEGQRPLGIEAGQLLALTRWIEKRAGTQHVRLESRGIRSQTVALVAAAIKPGLFSEVTVHDGMHSLAYLLNKPVHYENAADLFCLDFYKDFDLNDLATAASPTRVSFESYVNISAN